MVVYFKTSHLSSRYNYATFKMFRKFGYIMVDTENTFKFSIKWNRHPQQISLRGFLKDVIFAFILKLTETNLET